MPTAPYSAPRYRACFISDRSTARIDWAGWEGRPIPVVVETRIRFTDERTGKAVFSGQFAAVTDLEALDMSILGRDILNVFALIVDRRADTVCLLGQRHFYTIGVR